MGVLSDLATLILRETTNPPLTNKNTLLTLTEGDENIIKIFNALNDVLNGVNVPAYDNAKTYDEAGTVDQKFASYGSKIWSAVYTGSPTAFSGQTPEEGVYWTQISLAGMLGNPVALTKIAEAFDDSQIPSSLYETDWFSSSEKDLNSVPLTIVESMGVDSAIIPIEIIYLLDSGSVAFDFGSAGIHIAFDSDKTKKLGQLSGTYINSATDEYRKVPVGSFDIYFNDKVVLTSDADATVGDGVYYYKMIYKKITKPF